VAHPAGPSTPGRPPRQVAGLPQHRLLLAGLAFGAYVASIAGANWMISHVGTPGGGAHVLPVFFGLEAPSGVYLAGFTFVARDIVQRLAGLWAGAAAIVLGAAVSWWVATPALALASGGTFLLSETCDFVVYTPLQARSFPFAVLGSGLISDLVDSTVFLTLAGLPLSTLLPGQLVGKAWLVFAGGALAGVLRRYGPFQSPQYSYLTPKRQSPCGGATAGAAERSRAAKRESISPALRLPLPTSTSAPTIERTIWWQNAIASISKRRRPSPR
jgi:uncharacterized PurR-regulated membrane protein YhhQ (DUF165 family)